MSPFGPILALIDVFQRVFFEIAHLQTTVPPGEGNGKVPGEESLKHSHRSLPVIIVRTCCIHIRIRNACWLSFPFLMPSFSRIADFVCTCRLFLKTGVGVKPDSQDCLTCFLSIASHSSPRHEARCQSFGLLCSCWCVQSSCLALAQFLSFSCGICAV